MARGPIENRVTAIGYRLSAIGRACDVHIFRGLTAGDVRRFLELRGQLDANALIRQFPAWVRGRIAAQWT